MPAIASLDDLKAAQQDLLQAKDIDKLAPFDRCDREADYATAWAAFKQRGVEVNR